MSAAPHTGAGLASDSVQSESRESQPAATLQPAALRIGDPVSLERIERAHVEAVLGITPKLSAAAEILGIDPATLYRKRLRWGYPPAPLGSRRRRRFST